MGTNVWLLILNRVKWMPWFVYIECIIWHMTHIIVQPSYKTNHFLVILKIITYTNTIINNLIFLSYILIYMIADKLVKSLFPNTYSWNNIKTSFHRHFHFIDMILEVRFLLAERWNCMWSTVFNISATNIFIFRLSEQFLFAVENPSYILIAI